MLLSAVLTVTVQAQQADALKLTVTQGAPSPELSKKQAKKEAKQEAESPAPVIVEVRDDSGRIVPGARVAIDTPASPGKPILGWTDTEGHAYIDGVIPPGQAGKVAIVAQARFEGRLGSTTFNTTASLPPPPPEITRAFTFQKQHHTVRNTLIVAGIVAAAALAIALALTLPGGSKTIVPTPTSVSLGGVSVGSPQ